MSAPQDPIPSEERPPEEPGSFVQRLHARFGKGVDPEIHLQSQTESGIDEDRVSSDAEPSSSSSHELYRRLAGGTGVAGRRYRSQKEVARGGMGVIVRVWDEDLRRNLAMKVMHEPPPGEEVDPERLGRFLEEAQITGQLDHPGVVPVHDLGLDDRGHCYFTMRLVRGRELKEVLDQTRRGEEGWTITRALALILKVCEAMAYAHSKGVVHRDLKPSNVMVGRFGEVYIMDWGLARVLGRQDSHDLRLRSAQDASAVSLVRTVRQDESESDPDSPLVTMDGDVVGTPCYMSIEQARGKLEEVGPRSDVYSLGAILYYMLTGRAPYVEPDERVSPHTVLNRVLAGPPVPVGKLARETPVELVAICEKAMAREPEDRYGSMLEVADDIQAFLENRVVGAHGGGAVAEFRKWVVRNRGMAAATAALVLLTLASAFGFAWQKGRQLQALDREQRETAAAHGRAERSALEARRNEEQARRNLELALESKAEADENALAARRSEQLARRSSYLANVVAADYSLRLDDVVEARKRLEACAGDLRGWEWDHLALEAQSALLTLGPYAGIDAVAFLADGKRFIVLPRTGVVRLHAVETGELLDPRDFGAAFLDLRYLTQRRVLSVTRDGRLAGIAGRGHQVQLWDLGSGEQAGSLPASEDVVGHDESRVLTAVAFGPTGRLLASGDADGSVIVWDVASGSVHQRLPGSDEAVHAIAWSPLGERLAIASANDSIHVWDVESGREVRVLRGHQDDVLDLAWHPDGEALVSSSADRTAILWDVERGRLTKSFLGHVGAVNAVDFHPDGSRIVTGSRDRTIRIWEVESREMEVLRGHEDEVSDVVFGPDGTYLLSGGAEGYVRLWDARGDLSETVLVSPIRPVDSVAVEGALPESGGELAAADYAPAVERIAVAVHDGEEARYEIGIFDATTSELLSVLRGHQGFLTDVAFAPDGRTLLSGSLDKTARLWDVASGRCLRVLEGHEKWVSAVAFLPDASLVVTGSGDGRIRLWDPASGELVRELPAHEGRNAWVHDVAVHPGGELLASSSGDERIRLWDLASGEPMRLLSGHKRAVSALDFSPDGRLLLSGSLDATARVWDVETGECLHVAAGHDRQVNDVAFDRGGSRFATASAGSTNDASLRIWDVVTGEPLLELDDGLGTRISRDLPRRRGFVSVDFSTDGKRLLAASEIELRLWETGGIAERRAGWLDALERHERSQPIVDELFDRHFYLSDVLVRLRADGRLEGEALETAERMARIRGDDPKRLDETTRAVVTGAGSSAAELELALRRARAACELDPESPRLLCTLGMAQLRAGEAREAVSSLELAGEVMARVGAEGEEEERAEVVRLGYLAMAYGGVGDDLAARKMLAEARSRVERSPEIRADELVQATLEEAARTVGEG